MRRSGQSSALVLTLASFALGALASTTWAQSPVPGALEADGEGGGRLTVEVPPGAVPPGMTIRVVAPGSSEPPDALQAVPAGWTFYALEPGDVTFDTSLSADGLLARASGSGRFSEDQGTKVAAKLQKKA